MSGWCVRLLALLVCLNSTHGHPENYEYIQSIDDQIQELADDVNESLDDLEDDVLHLRQGLKKSRSALDRRLKKGIRDAQVSWEAKLNNELIPFVLPELVTAAVEEVFRRQSLDKGATDVYKLELTRLKKTIHIVKAQMYQFQRDVDRVSEENNVLRKTIEKMDEDFAVYKNRSSICNCVQESGQTTPLVSAKTSTLSSTTTSLVSPKTSILSSTVGKETSLTTTLSTVENDVAVTPATDVPNSDTIPVIDIQREATSFLVVPYMSPRKTFFSTPSISAKYAWGMEYNTYPLTLQMVLSVAYVASRKLLLLSRINPDRIVVSPFYQPQISILKDGVPASSMAVDEEKQLIFHTHWRWKTVNRMNFEGNSYKRLISIINGHGPLRSIALDVKNERVYTCDTSMLYIVPYDGGESNIVLVGEMMSALAFDPLAGILYYCNDKNVMKFYPGNSTTVTMATLPYSPLTFQLHKKFADTLLLSSQVGGIIDIIYIMDQYPRYHLTKPKSRGGLLICLIPEWPPALDD